MKKLLRQGRWLMVAICAALLASTEAWAGQNENRFLIVVDTASSMRASSNSVEQAVFELFKSEMKGEFRPGDTIGFWTFADKLHSDLPMQFWSEERNQRIARSLVTILREQGYGGR